MKAMKEEFVEWDEVQILVEAYLLAVEITKSTDIVIWENRNPIRGIADPGIWGAVRTNVLSADDCSTLIRNRLSEPAKNKVTALRGPQVMTFWHVIEEGDDLVFSVIASQTMAPGGRS